MGLLSKAEDKGQDINASGISLSEKTHASPHRKGGDISSLDFSEGGVELFLLSTRLAASTALYDESLGMLETAFARPNAALRGENGEVKLLLFTSQNFAEKLLQTHIRHMLTPLLGDAANLLVVIKAGHATSVEEAKKILEG